MDSAVNMLNFFDFLPEGCIAKAISLTTPADACCLPLVASIFRSAADSDAVWDRFLPFDFQDIIARSVDRDATSKLLSFSRKKDLYLHLCDHPLLIDAGTKIFSMDKKSGKISYMLAARELSIAWGDTPTHWKWMSSPESRFGEIAELVKVCWLEIRGKISKRALSPETRYAAYLVFKSPEYMHGLMFFPAEVWLDGGSRRLVYLDANDIDARRRKGFKGVWDVKARPNGLGRWRVRSGEVQFPKTRVDGWLEVELGECFVKHEDHVSDLEMCVMEVTNKFWKNGLIVQGIDIRPKF